jgi:hypothetical protein
MKIKYSIVSSNSDRKYLSFWPRVRDLWIRMGITPILVFIGDEDKVINREEYIIHKIKKINNFPEAFQSQISRLFIPKHYQDEVLLLSDIDMLPINKDYFTKTTLPHDEDSFVIFSSNAYENSSNEIKYPICYNAAKGKTYSEVLDLNCNFEEFSRRLWDDHPLWDSDEFYLGKKVNSFPHEERVIKLKRTFNNNLAEFRIDRAHWSHSNISWKFKEYIDCHSLRPYKRYKKEIDEVIKRIYEQRE